MANEATLILPDTNTLKKVRSELGEDPERFEKHVENFKEWLNCETHLPSDVDERLIGNFVRLCKGDLEKAKGKFEKFLAARNRMKSYYANRNVDEEYFKTSVQRQVLWCPNLTSDGYRVGIFRLPNDPDEFDFDKILNYGFLMLDYLFYEDISAGIIIVYDLANFTPQHIAKVNIKTLLETLNLMFNISPLRLKEIHLLQPPVIAQAMINVAKSVLSEKLAKRVLMHKNPDDLVKHISTDILPKEYGGSGKSSDEIGDELKQYFIQNGAAWVKMTEELKLVGPVPQNKKHLYSFEECEMGGTFRKLAID